ncbi:MAG: hypothetical protein ACFFA2_04490 [Promethearchaeota archaeon]
MNFIKTFFISLIIYLGLNLVFALIMVYSSPILSAQPDVGIYIIAMMFGPITTSPSVAWIDSGIISLIQSFQLGGDPLTATILFLYYIIPPLLTVIIGGAIADSTSIAFLSWLLVAIISIIAYILIIVFAGSNPLVSPSLYFGIYTLLWFLYGPTDLYIAMILFGLLNIFLYGCVSFLVTRKKL